MKEIKKGELGVVGRGVSGGRVGPVCNQKRERERKRVFFFFGGVWRERKREREREDFNIKTVRGIVKAS